MLGAILTLEGQSTDFGLTKSPRMSSSLPKCLIQQGLSTESVHKPVENPNSLLTLEGRHY